MTSTPHVTPRKGNVSDLMPPLNSIDLKTPAVNVTPDHGGNCQFLQPTMFSPIQVAYVRSPKRGPFFDDIEHELKGRSRKMETVFSQKCSAYAHLVAGRLEGAEEVGMECLRSSILHFGHDHPELLYTLILLAECHLRMDNLENANAHLQHAYRICESAPDSGKDEEFVLLRAQCCSDLSLLYRRKRLYSENIEICKELCDLKKQKYGEQHEETAHALVMLGVALWQGGKLVGAVDVLYRAKDILVGLPGASAYSVAVVYNNLGNVLMSQGAIESALAFYEKGKATLESIGAASVKKDIATCLANMGTAYRVKNNLAKAMEMYGEARGIRADLLGEDHFLVAHCDVLSGSVLMSQGQTGRALDLFHNARSVRETTLGSAHPETATSYMLEGHAQLLMGKTKSALSLYQSARDILVKTFSSTHPLVMNVDMHIAGAYLMQGRSHAALRCYSTWLKKPGVDLGVLYNDVANVLRQQGSLEESLATYKKSLDMMEKEMGYDHPSIAAVCTNAGHIYLQRRKPDSALKLYRRANIIRLRAFGLENLDTAASFLNMALAEEQAGRKQMALEHMRKHVKCVAGVVGSDHPYLSQAKQRLAQLIQRTGR